MADMTYGPYPGTILDWHDGDTCHVQMDLGFGILLAAGLSCRIWGINAPEIFGTEKPQGEAARQHALELAPPGTKVQVISHGWDKYGGRFDGSLTLPDGSDYATRMVEDGFAVVYDES